MRDPQDYAKAARMNPAVELLFNILNQEADLDKLVNEKREEDLYLEFKQKVDRRSSSLDDKDREAFSKALSGFANADGGILIFGMETKKGPDGIDRASSLKEINDFQKFRSRLMDSVGTAAQPFVEGVRIDAIPAASGSKGYLKCLIPQSDRVPHRAMAADREYWRRTSMGYRRMEHYELEEVFGRRLRPSLSLRVELRPRPDPADPHEELHFYVLNEGRGVARHFGMMCTMENVSVQHAGGGMENISHLNEGRPTVQYYDPQSVVHANGIYRNLGLAILIRPGKGTPLTFSVAFYAENAETRRYKVALPPGAPIDVPPR